MDLEVQQRDALQLRRILGVKEMNSRPAEKSPKFTTYMLKRVEIKVVFLLFFFMEVQVALQILITEDILTLSFIELFFLIKEGVVNQYPQVR